MIRRIAAWTARRLAGALARRALTAAVYGDCARGHDITAKAIDRGGRPAGLAMAGTWCETLCADVPQSLRRQARHGMAIFQPFLWDPESGTEREVDSTAPCTRWASRMVAAHASGDYAMCQDLLDAVPDGEIEAHLARLLHMAATATTIRGGER